MGEAEIKDRLALTDLEPKMQLKGKVTNVELFGAFVDVGAETDGLIHISKLKRGRVNRVEDVVNIGDEVQVWVHRVEPETGRFELSMLKPVDLEWKAIKPNTKVEGKVVRIEKFGVFVDIGAERPGLVHISEMSTEYVRDPHDLVSVGDQVEVKILDVNRRKRQIRLTMKDQVEVQEEIPEEVIEEEVATAMEFALRKALQQTEDAPEKTQMKSASSGKQKGAEELEDILSRTLHERVQTASSSK